MILSLLFSLFLTATDSPALTIFNKIRIMEIAGQVEDDWNLPGNSHARELEQLELWAEHKGIVVAHARIVNKGFNGHSIHSRLVGWMVTLDANLPVNSQFRVLAHELGHVYSPKGVYVKQGDGEVFAEVVAATVCERVGLKTTQESASYLYTLVPLDQQVEVVYRWQKDIDRLSNTLVNVVSR